MNYPRWWRWNPGFLGGRPNLYPILHNFWPNVLWEHWIGICPWISGTKKGGAVLTFVLFSGYFGGGGFPTRMCRVNSHVVFFSEKMQAPKLLLTSIFGLRTTWKPIRYCRLCFRMPCAQVALKQSENDASVAYFHKRVKLDHRPFSVRP